MCKVLPTTYGVFVLLFASRVPDPVAVTSMSCLSQRRGSDGAGRDPSPGMILSNQLLPIRGFCFLHSPSALVCGWDRVQNAEAGFLFLFLDSSFPKCCFHLPGCPYSRCVLFCFLFPNTQPLTIPAEARARVMMRRSPLAAGAGIDALGAKDVPSQAGLHSPPPFGCKYLLAS